MVAADKVATPRGQGGLEPCWSSNANVWIAGAVAAVMVASQRRKKGERSERV